jgi:hypothetical protein
MEGGNMNKMQTLHSFWSGFGLKAYDENSVPDNAELPYITYEASDDDFGNALGQTASLWYRSSGWNEITEKEQQISDFITRGGRMIAFDGGAMWIQKASPWAQRMNDPSDEMIRRIVLNITIEFIN